MVAYADTSFLVSLYAQDANSTSAQRLVATFKATPLAFTALHRHESRNAVRLAVYRKWITAEQCEAVLRAIEEDVDTGSLVETPIAWEDVFAEAENLSGAYTSSLGTRATDVLHVAAARAIGAQVFLTFDTRQKALALKAGLKVKP